MVESAIDELNELRKEPERIIKSVEQKHDSPGVTWQESRFRRRRRMDDKNAEDEPAETPEDDWKRNTFYVSVDTIINSLKNRFQKTNHCSKNFRCLLQAVSHSLRRISKPHMICKRALTPFVKCTIYMRLDVLTNCSISLVLFRNSTVHLSASKKMMMIAARTTTMSMMMMTMMMMTTLTTVVMVMMIIMMTLTTTMTKSQARPITSKATMVSRKLKNNGRKKFHLSLTLFYSFVTRIIIWLMHIQLSVAFMLLLSSLQ